MVERRVLDSNLEKKFQSMIKKIPKKELEKYLFAKSVMLPDVEELKKIINEIGIQNDPNFGTTSTISPDVYNALYDRFNITNNTLAQAAFKDIIALFTFSNDPADKKVISISTSDSILDDAIETSTGKKGIEIFVPNKSNDIILSNGEGVFEKIIKSNEFLLFTENYLLSLAENKKTTKLEVVNEIKSILYIVCNIYEEKTNGYDKSLINSLLTDDNLFTTVATYIVDKLEICNCINYSHTAKITKSKKKDYPTKLTKYYEAAFNGTTKSVPFVRTEVEEELLNLLLTEITYMSAKDKPYISIFKNQNVFTQNGVILPQTLLEELLKEFPLDNSKSVLTQGISNYYMFLFNNDITFYDQSGKKYKMSLDDLHIVGLESDVNIMFEEYRNRKNNLPSNISSLQDFIEINPVPFPRLNNIDPRFNSTIEDFINGEIKYNLQRDSITMQDFETRSRILINVQAMITEIMTDDSLEHKIELLVYFCKKLELTEPQHPVSFVKSPLILQGIVESNVSYFGNDFLNQIKGNKKREIYKKFLEASKREEQTNLLYEKYNSIEQLQTFLNYKHQQFARYVLYSKNNHSSGASPNGNYGQWRAFFEDKISQPFSIKTVNQSLCFYETINGVDNEIIHIENKSNLGCELYKDNTKICDIKFTSNGKVNVQNINPDYIIEYSGPNTIKLKNVKKMDIVYQMNISPTSHELLRIEKGMSKFAIANMFINDAVYANKVELEKSRRYSANVTTYQTLTNLFKNFDKLLYLNYFNYVVDMESIYATDLQAANPNDLAGIERCILCEMTALKESLYALFNGIDENEIAHFLSIQNAEEITSIESKYSVIPEFVDFQEKTYKTIIGLDYDSSKKFVKNVITQKHSSFRDSNFTLEEILNNFTDGKTLLRIATSSPKNNEEKTKIRDNELDEQMHLLDIVERNIYGIVNAVNWIGQLFNNEFSAFANTRSIHEFWGYTPIGMDETTFHTHCIKGMMYLNIQKNLKNLCSILQSYLRQNITTEEKNRALKLMKIITNYTGIKYDISSNTIDDQYSQEQYLEKILFLKTENLEKHIIEMDEDDYIRFIYLITTKFPLSCLVSLINLENTPNKNHPRVSKVLDIMHQKSLVENAKDYDNTLQYFSRQDDKRTTLEQINQAILGYKRFNTDLNTSFSEKSCSVNSYLEYKIKMYSEINKYYNVKAQILMDKKQELEKKLESSSTAYTLLENENKEKIAKLQMEIVKIKEERYTTYYMQQYVTAAKKIIVTPDEELEPSDIDELTKYSYYIEQMDPIIYKLVSRKIGTIKREDLKQAINKYQNIFSCNHALQKHISKLTIEEQEQSVAIDYICGRTPVEEATIKRLSSAYNDPTTMLSRLERIQFDGYNEILKVLNTLLSSEYNEEFIKDYVKHIDAVIEFRQSMFSRVKSKTLLEFELEKIVKSPKIADIKRRIKERLFIMSGNITLNDALESLETKKKSTKGILIDMNQIIRHLTEEINSNRYYSEDDKNKIKKRYYEWLMKNYPIPEIIIKELLHALKIEIEMNNTLKSKLKPGQKEELINKVQIIIYKFVNSYNELIDTIDPSVLMIELPRLSEEKIIELKNEVGLDIFKMNSSLKPISVTAQSGCTK